MRSLILNECLVVPVLQFNVLTVAYYSLPSIKGNVIVASVKNIKAKERALVRAQSRIQDDYSTRSVSLNRYAYPSKR